MLKFQNHLRQIIAFALSRITLCNCHSFSFSPSRQYFGTDCRKFFRGGFKTSYWGSVWPRSDLFLGHTKNISVNIFLKVYIRDVCGTWHDLLICWQIFYASVVNCYCTYIFKGANYRFSSKHFSRTAILTQA